MKFWTIDKERQLLASAAKYDRNWVDVSNDVKDRSPSQCHDKYRKLVGRTKQVAHSNNTTSSSFALNADSTDDENVRIYSESWNMASEDGFIEFLHIVGRL